jgi:hypothetical protein
VFVAVGFIIAKCIVWSGGPLKFALTEVEFMLATVAHSSTVVSVVLAVG